MKALKTILFCTMLLAMATVRLDAAPVLTLNPSSGQLSGAPGQTVGFGFTLTQDDTLYLFLTSVTTSNLNGVATFTDYLTPWSDARSYILRPGSVAAGSPLTLTFQAGTPGTATGLGAFALAGLAGTVSGTIQVTYDLYSADPYLDANANLIRSSQALANFTLSAVPNAAVPEPATLFVTGFSLLVVGCRRKLRIS